MSTLRLDRFLANAGAGTRTEVKQAIRKGLVKVGTETIRQPDYKLDTGRESVTLAGQVIVYEQYQYFMFHKPAGCVTAATDKLHETVMDYITVPGKDKLFPVGRLDLDTEGLLLITNDGPLAHQLLSPKKHVEKTYLAHTAHALTKADMEHFETGLDIGDEKPTLPARIEQKDDCEYLVTIVEGRFHQIKRMFAALENEVTYLKRLSMGTLRLDDKLLKGSFRPLTSAETERLKGEIC